MLRFSVAAALPGCCKETEEDLSKLLQSYKEEEQQEAANNTCQAQEEQEQTDDNVTKASAPECYNDAFWVKSHSFLRKVAFGDYSVYKTDLESLPSDTRFSIKDVRDLNYLYTLLPIERKHIWKQINWCSLDSGIALSIASNKPMLIFHRACLFGEKNGAV